VLCNAFFRVYFRYRSHNAPRLKGPFVLVANHSSFLDPVFLGAGLRRQLVFMMTDVYYRSPRSRWFYSLFGAIPVAVRGGNRAALRAARETLEQGGVLTIFPEGGLSRDGQPFLGSPGAVALVLGQDVPVVPAAIVGAYDALPVHRKLPRPRRVTVRFGDPIPAEQLADPDANRKQRLTQATERIMRAIAELRGVRAREDELRELRG